MFKCPKERRAIHAGSWYTADAQALSKDLKGWLEDSNIIGDPQARGIIAPHAGYSYSGRCAAYAFAQIDPSIVKRIFILGPSHHHYTEKCSLSVANVYKTPLGDIPVDQEIYSQLKETGKFEEMKLSIDEAEHSMEMHLPYLVQVMRGNTFTIVPILVGAVSPQSEAMYGELLSPFLNDKVNFFSISSDFCHWGSRFRYKHYDQEFGPIYKSIEVLDRKGMEIIEAKNPDGFTRYLQDLGNTICGRHPIAVFLHMVKFHKSKFCIKFVKYEQSFQCTAPNHHSVSYASAVALESD